MPIRSLAPRPPAGPAPRTPAPEFRPGLDEHRLQPRFELPGAHLEGPEPFDAEGRFLVLEGGVAAVRQAADGSLVQRLSRPEYMSAAAPSADGRLAATGSQQGVVRLWDALGGAELGAWTDQASEIYTLALSPDGGLLASGNSGSLVLRSTATGEKVATFDYSDRSLHDRGVIHACFSPDGSRLAFQTSDGNAHLVDLENPQEETELVDQGSRGEPFRFSADSRRLLFPARDWKVGLWDLDTDRVMALKAGPNGEMEAAFAPDGVHLATGDSEGVIHLWDLGTMEEEKSFPGEGSPVRGLAFSPDGQTLVSGGLEGVALWDVNTSARRDSWQGPDMVTDVWFTPDGQKVVASLLGAASGLEVLDVVKGRSDLGRMLDGPTGPVPEISSEDGWVIIGGVRLERH